MTESDHNYNYDPLGYFKNKITELLLQALDTLKIDTKIILETPPQGLGDFAFPVFSLASLLKKSPNKIAQDLQAILPEEPWIKTDVKGPYLNFIVDDSVLSKNVLNTIFELDKRFGNLSPVDVKVILEHTSANPTDKLHVGRARNPIIGDTLARILRCAGFDVETQYYVDDMGKQSARKILANRHKDLAIDKSKFKTDYQWATSATTVSSEYYDLKKENELNQIMDGLESGNEKVLQEAEGVCKQMMDEVIIPSLASINVHVDRYVNESQFMLDKSVSKVIDDLKTSEYFGTEDGAYFIDLTQFDTKSDKDKFFFVRSDGKSLYATRDIAYHHWKFSKCDIAINILGEDHKLESEYVRIGLQLTGSDRYPESIFYAFVNLPEGRMSTRKGKVVYIDDLVDESVKLAMDEVKKRRDDLALDEVERISKTVGIGAVRYNIIRVQAEKKIVFKWEDALNFEGDSAPFIQYAHARACSILRKAQDNDITYKTGEFDSKMITNQYELDHLRMLAKLPGTVSECASKRAAHILASYAHEIAASFNQFYRECPVLQAESPEQVQSRLCIVDATRIVLRNTLELLGIAAPDRM
jgi:arginyl-tRNA synthetase